MKKFIVLVLFLIGCGISKAPADVECTNLCTEYYETPTEGYWMGDDAFWGIKRCICYSTPEGVYHHFSLDR